MPYIFPTVLCGVFDNNYYTFCSSSYEFNSLQSTVGFSETSWPKLCHPRSPSSVHKARLTAQICSIWRLASLRDLLIPLPSAGDIGGESGRGWAGGEFKKCCLMDRIKCGDEYDCCNGRSHYRVSDVSLWVWVPELSARDLKPFQGDFSSKTKLLHLSWASLIRTISLSHQSISYSLT